MNHYELSPDEMIRTLCHLENIVRFSGDRTAVIDDCKTIAGILHRSINNGIVTERTA